MLEIKNLAVEVDGKEIIHDVSMSVPDGEIHVLFGPNGSGKTTLMMSLMGFPKYKITAGSILFNGQDVTYMSLNERAKLGIGMSFQRPPTITGVKTRDIVETIAKRFNSPQEEIDKFVDELRLHDFMDRDLNAGFSGGEIKRSELLQLMVQDPPFILLDEPESGVDLDNIDLIGKTIRALFWGEDHCPGRPPHRHSGIVITHTGYILNYIGGDKAYVLTNGYIGCSGNAQELLQDLKTQGYERCMKCRCNHQRVSNFVDHQLELEQ